ncbi:zinc finger, SWIM-type, MULE transposase domain, FHY3/FAR1 family [Artemisia annua]|uniref:Zinc finger, SWIM-type, MULE transposase domain, FHY3/FAR1 family n=1 Tax=Artemisia annua TaxID=35608 RepID=A0A2U1KJW5_ARTAN|nr:zinc finger, SWIM-type, MULE transposase domain, FHY3/FAR1 family [Artemisia annua]
MDSQRYVQRKNDHKSRYNTPEYRTELKLERDASDLYSLSVFYDVQDELVSSIVHCLSINVEKIGLFEKYFIRDNEVKKWKYKNSSEVYEVLYSSCDMSVTCTCKRFELFGLLCRHIFYVLRMNNVQDFPNEYVLDRWSKTPASISFDATQIAAETSSCSDLRAIRQIVEDTVDRLMPFKDKLEMYRLHLLELLSSAEDEVPVAPNKNKADIFCSVLGVTEPAGVEIQVPRQSKNKGTGSHSRWKNMDKILRNKEAESSKKRRTCFTCGKAEGHNSRTCPYKNNISGSCKRSTRSTRSADVDYQE